MNFKRSQRAEIAKIIQTGGFDPKDFDLSEKEIRDNPTLILKHKSTEAIFAVDNIEGNFGVLYAPSDVSLKPVRLTGISWNLALQYLTSWVRYVKEESEADDPWDEKIREEFDEFHNDTSEFTIQELERLDSAIESSFKHLVATAEEQGHKVTNEELKQITEDIRFLKEEARKSSKRKWLDTFMGVILGKLVDWGLSTTLVGTVFAKLIEMSHEVLKLTSYIPPHVGP